MISDAVILSIVASIPPTLAAIAALIVSLQNGRKVDEIKVATDGMKDALVQATDKAATEKGKAIGVETERVRAGS